MPVATFPHNLQLGLRRAVQLRAAHPAYGGPHGLARLVDVAHREGLAVILDVVYNHIGPGSEAIPRPSARTSPIASPTRSGAPRSTIRKPGVREWAIQNAEMWTHDYSIDGLRLDAVHAIYDDSEPHVLGELKPNASFSTRTRDFRDEPGRPPAARRVGTRRDVARQPAPRVHVLLTGEKTGYFADFGTARWPCARASPRGPGPGTCPAHGTVPGPGPRELRRVRAEPRPDREPCLRRPPSAGRSTGSLLACRALLAAHAARVHGRGVRGAEPRSSSSLTTSTPRSPTRPARAAAARSSGPPRLPTVMRPTRRPRETLRALEAGASKARCTLSRELSVAAQRRCPRELGVTTVTEAR